MTLSTTFLNDKPRGCSGCKYSTIGSGFVPIWYPPNAKLAFLAEAPGENEVAEREPMVGRSGYLLMKSVGKAGYTRGDIVIGNSISCHPPGNNYPVGQLRKSAEAFCRQYDGFNGKDLESGGLHKFNPDTYLVTLHPSYIARTYQMVRVFESDILKSFRLYETGKRVLVLLGQKAVDLVLPNVNVGVSKLRGHWGELDWNEFRNRHKTETL